jgi:hypothetical protein
MGSQVRGLRASRRRHVSVTYVTLWFPGRRHITDTTEEPDISLLLVHCLTSSAQTQQTSCGAQSVLITYFISKQTQHTFQKVRNVPPLFHRYNRKHVDYLHKFFLP